MAARRYAPGPNADELALIGITAEDVADNTVVEVWPENWAPMNVLLAMETQWRTVQGGVTGLDYSVLPMIFTLCGVKRKKQNDVLGALQVMEQEALKQMSQRS